MTEEAELAAFEGQLRAKRKLLAIVGLIAVGSLLVWKFATMAGHTYGSGSGPSSDYASRPTPGIELEVGATGRVSARGCADPVEACVKRASRTEHDRQAGGRFRALVHVAEGAPQTSITEARDVLLLNDFVPVNVPAK
jgi:hypothetical protein